MTFQRFGWPVATAHCRASLSAGFHRLRAAGDEEDPVEVARHLAGQPPGQFLRRLVFEMQAIGEGALVHLPLHGVEHIAVAVADIDRPSARSTRR